MTGKTTLWEITNFKLELCIVELNDEGMSMVNEVSPFNEPIYIHSSSYRHTPSPMPTGTSEMYATLVLFRFSSLKAIHLCPRLVSHTTGVQANPVGSRINPAIASYWYRLGSFLCPQKPINLINASNTGSFSEAFMETLRSFHALNSYLISSSITSDYYNVSDVTASDGSIYTAYNDTALNSYKNAFGLGFELESLFY